MPKRKAKKNIYRHEIDLTNLAIANGPKEEFRNALESIAYKGYEVEQLTDGRKIVITKPGGKFTYGTIRRDDFMVWIYDPTQKSLWLISHQNITDDLQEKGAQDPRSTISIIDALEKVYDGTEPDDVLREVDLQNVTGETPEAIMKAYKWIWGQEDVNYPNGKGRAMSWEGWKKEKNGEWIKTNKGIADIRNRLKQLLKSHPSKNLGSE